MRLSLCLGRIVQPLGLSLNTLIAITPPTSILGSGAGTIVERLGFTVTLSPALVAVTPITFLRQRTLGSIVPKPDVEFASSGNRSWPAFDLITLPLSARDF
jgi:hypothetical protein